MRIRRTAVLLTVFATTAVVAVAVPASAKPGPPELISVSLSGEEGSSLSGRQTISATGRYVVFDSEANDLVPDDYNVATDVFLRDRWTDTTSRVSLSVAGGATNGASDWPSISGTGRYIAFASGASDLVAGDTNESLDIFVLDRSTGVTARVSTSSAGAQSNGRSARPAISLNGRYVAFLSDATNLVPGDTSETTDVFVHDLRTGVTTRENVARTGEADSGSLDVAISADGRQVAFSSPASNLVAGDSNGTMDVFVRDRLTKVTTRATVSSTGVEAGPETESHGVAISADGRYVVYESTASNLVPDDTNNRSDVFRRDLRAGVTSRVSVSRSGEQFSGGSSFASISGDGRYVTFGSYVGPDDSVSRVFLRDTSAGTTTPVVTAGYESGRPKISADGRHVSFISWGRDISIDSIDVFAARLR